MRSGIKTIVTGVLLFIVGAVVVPLVTILLLILDDSNEKQFMIPGNTQVVIEEPGRYYLWNDYQTVFQGKSYTKSQTIPDDIKITIKNEETGELFDFVSDTSISSSRGSSSKNSIGYIEVQELGSVHIDILGGNEERIFSFAQSGLLAMFGLILGGFGLSMILSLSGIGLTIWGIVKLVRSKKKSEQGAEGDALGRAP